MLYRYIYQRWGGWIQTFPTALSFLFNKYLSKVSGNYPHLPIFIEIFQSKYNYSCRCFSIQLNSLFTWISQLHNTMNTDWFRYIATFSSSCRCIYISIEKKFMNTLLTTCKIMSTEISKDIKQYRAISMEIHISTLTWLNTTVPNVLQLLIAT